MVIKQHASNLQQSRPAAAFILQKQHTDSSQPVRAELHDLRSTSTKTRAWNPKLQQVLFKANDDSSPVTFERQPTAF